MGSDAETGKEIQEIDTQEETEGGSLADILERSRQQLLVDPVEAGSEEVEEEEPPEKLEQPAGVEILEEKSASEEKSEGEPEGKPKEEEAPKFQPKHQSWEETEKARLEAEQKMHQATQEAADLRKENEELKKGPKEPAEPAEKPAETLKPVTKEERKARVKTALATIRDLDESDPEYDEKVAEAWAEAGVGGTEAPFPSKDEIKKLVDEQVQERLSVEREAEKEAERQKDEQDRQREANKAARDMAEKLASEAGLDMKEGAADYILFWDAVPRLPKDLKAKPGASSEEQERTFIKQVDWTVGEVRRLKGLIVQSKPGKTAEDIQRENAVLERGSNRPTRTPSQPETFTLGGIIDHHRNQRRI